MVGTFDAARVRAETGGAYDGPWTATLNSLVARGGHDLVLSIGQVSCTSSPSGTMKKRGPNLALARARTDGRHDRLARKWGRVVRKRSAVAVVVLRRRSLTVSVMARAHAAHTRAALTAELLVLSRSPRCEGGAA